MPEMLIGGEWRAASAHEEIEVVNPATEEIVGAASRPATPTTSSSRSPPRSARSRSGRPPTSSSARAILAKAADLIEEQRQGRSRRR